jgi:MFS transporter, OPA family, solute carrier family 37 (glycerol-3-phosphate transporter), member 3
VENQPKERVSFIKAWLIPRVFLYSATLFTVKLAVNSMLLWMPLLLKEYKGYSVYQIANVSSFFDSGGILGSFLMGYLSDKLYSKRSPISFLAVIVASIIGFTLTYHLQFMNQITLSAMLFLFGFIVSGLNNIISASCAADIGKQQIVQASQKSQSTVAGIIDGSGSLGAAIGQIIIGVSVTKWGWQ